MPITFCEDNDLDVTKEKLLQKDEVTFWDDILGVVELRRSCLSSVSTLLKLRRNQLVNVCAFFGFNLVLWSF